jgi:hypothetical protein
MPRPPARFRYAALQRITSRTVRLVCSRGSSDCPACLDRWDCWDRIAGPLQDLSEAAGSIRRDSSNTVQSRPGYPDQWLKCPYWKKWNR